MLEIEIADERVVLLKEKLLWWPSEKSLILSDLHWGKSGHFRKNGIAIPQNVQEKDEVILAQLIQNYKIERLIITGDLFHSKSNKETDSFCHWRNHFKSVTIDLILGNHDVLPLSFYTACDLRVYKEKMILKSFIFSHDKKEHTKFFNIYGHVHPGIKISGSGRQSISLACFCHTRHSMILPAFGSFTGRHYIKDKDFDHIYLITPKEVIAWK